MAEAPNQIAEPGIGNGWVRSYGMARWRSERRASSSTRSSNPSSMARLTLFERSAPHVRSP